MIFFGKCEDNSNIQTKRPVPPVKTKILKCRALFLLPKADGNVSVQRAAWSSLELRKPEGKGCILTEPLSWSSSGLGGDTLGFKKSPGHKYNVPPSFYHSKIRTPSSLCIFGHSKFVRIRQERVCQKGFWKIQKMQTLNWLCANGSPRSPP